LKKEGNVSDDATKESKGGEKGSMGSNIDQKLWLGEGRKRAASARWKVWQNRRLTQWGKMQVLCCLVGFCFPRELSDQCKKEPSG